MYDLLKKNSAFFIPYIFSILIGMVFLAFWSRTDISLFINGHNNPYADRFFSDWTNIGLGYLILPIALVLAFINFRYMIMAVVCFLLAFVVNDSIKFVLETPRPLIVFGQMHQDFYHVPGVDIYSWYSFPSGHSAITFSLFCLLALQTKQPVLKFVFFVIAFLVGYSRIYLGEHFLPDVIGGSVIGVSSAILTYKMLTNWKALNKFAGIDKPLINFRSR